MKSRPFLRFRTLLFLSVLVLAFLAFVPLALAQGEEVVRLTGELQGDQYAAGDTVIVDEGALIHGDLLAAGRVIIVYGTVDGSVIAAGNRVEVHGKVGHAVRIAGGGEFIGPSPSGGLFVDADIVGDLVAAGLTLEVSPAAKVGGNAYCFANTATLGGSFGGNLLASGSTVRVTGSVAGDAELECSPCQVMGGAVINGKLTYTSSRQAEIIGVVHGTITHLLPEARAEVPAVQRFGEQSWWWIRGLLGLLVAGALLLWILPAASAAVVEALRTRPGHSVGWGALLLFGLPIVLLVLVVLTLVLGLVALGLYFLTMYLSHIFVGCTIGRVIFGALKWDTVRGARFWEMMLGVVLLSLAGLIPYLGGWIKFAVLLFGMGAALVAWWRSRRPAAPAVAGGQG